MIHRKLEDQIKSIKKIRVSHRIPQKDIARHGCTTIQTISKWESDNYMKVPVTQLINIMNYINSIVDIPEFKKAADDIVKICQNLKRVRDINHITQYDLAEICGVTSQSVWRWENTHYQSITFEHLISIIRYIESKNDKGSFTSTKTR